MRRLAALCALFSVTTFVPAAQAQEMPATYKQVLDALGKTGDFKDKVLKVNIPRNDLSVTVANVKTPTALDLIGRNAAPPAAASAASAPAIDTAKIAQIVGQQGDQNGAVYKITVGRSDLKLTEMGAPINARMGLNTWAAFVGTNENAAVAGDIAMLANEVTPVLKALRKNGIDVVAIHHHMIDTRPAIYFLHYWGTGSTEKLANAFKAALGELGKSTKTTAAKG